MNILRVRQAAAREDRIAFKLSGRLAMSASAPTSRAHALTHAHLHAAELAFARNACMQHPILLKKRAIGQAHRHEENTATFHYFRLFATKLWPSARDTLPEHASFASVLCHFSFFVSFFFFHRFVARYSPHNLATVCTRHRNFLLITSQSTVFSRQSMFARYIQCNVVRMFMHQPASQITNVNPWKLWRW